MKSKKLELLWRNIVTHSKELIGSSTQFFIKENQYEMFERIIQNMYSDLINTAMEHDVKFLDRHKVGAIIIIALIQLRVIEYREESYDRSNELLYQLAFSSGLSFMLYELNHERLTSGKNSIAKYVFPSQMFGKANYCENVVKMLYLSKSDLNNSVLFLSNILFLIEAYTLVCTD